MIQGINLIVGKHREDSFLKIYMHVGQYICTVFILLCSLYQSPFFPSLVFPIDLLFPGFLSYHYTPSLFLTSTMSKIEENGLLLFGEEGKDKE